MLELVFIAALIAAFYFGGFYWGMATLFVLVALSPGRQPNPQGSDQYQQAVYRDNDDNKLMAMIILAIITIAYGIFF